MLLLLPALELLLVPRGFDGIEIGGLSRRVIAKADPDQSGEEYREQCRSGPDGRRYSDHQPTINETAHTVRFMGYLRFWHAVRY